MILQLSQNWKNFKSLYDFGGRCFNIRDVCIKVYNRDGAVVRALASHQCGLGSIPARCHMLSSLSVLVLAPRVFLPEGGGGCTALYGLYRYGPRNRVGFLEVLDP